MSENVLLKKFLVEYSKLGSRLFRNNTGMGWTGILLKPAKTMTVKVDPGDVILKKARPFHAGFPKGSSDLIGWTSIQITPDMVGKYAAIFTGVEVKTPNVRATKEQVNFTNEIRSAGGIGVIARKFQDVISAISEYAHNDLNSEDKQ